MQLIRGSSLRIDKLEESDSATYTCRICNADQVEEQSSELTSLTNKKTSDYDSKFNNTRLDISSLERDECDERSGVLKILGNLFLFNLNSCIHLNMHLKI